MKKGIIGSVIAIVLILITSIFVARYAFKEDVIYQKRTTQDKLLSLGNEVELYLHLLENSGNLALLQAVHDIGNNVVIDRKSDMYYDLNNHLPYLDRIEEDGIIKNIESLSENYFYNYVKSYQDYLKEKSDEESNKGFTASWDLKWFPDTKVNMDANEVSASFGKIVITYSSCKLSDDEAPTCMLENIRIEREIRVESKIKTNFGEALDISENIINEFRSGIGERYVCCSSSSTSSTSFPTYSWQQKNECKTDVFVLRLFSREENCEPKSCNEMCINSGSASGSWDETTQVCICEHTISGTVAEDTLNEIKNKYQKENIEIKLTKNDGLLTISVFDKEPYGVYDFSFNDVRKKNLGLTFNLDLGATTKVKYNALRDELKDKDPRIVECTSWSVISKKDKVSDICGIMLSK